MEGGFKNYGAFGIDSALRVKSDVGIALGLATRASISKIQKMHRIYDLKLTPPPVFSFSLINRQDT